MGKTDGIDQKTLAKAVDDYLRKAGRLPEPKDMAQLEQRMAKLEERLTTLVKKVEENTKARLAEHEKRMTRAMDVQRQSIMKELDRSSP